MIRKVTWSGMGTNFLLSCVKFTVGYLGSSQAVIADAVHSLSDMSTDIAVITGVRFWSAPPDENHPYGHQRIEALVTIAIGLALVGVAVGLAYNALTNIQQGHAQTIGLVAIIGPVFSIICKELLYRWTVKVGNRVKSAAVIANAWHHRSDGLSSIPALIAVVVSALYPEWGFVDHIGAIVISVFIFKVAWDIITPALKEVIDTGASAKTQANIRDLTIEVEGVLSAHAIRTRKLGSRLHVDLHILVEPELSVREGHNISGKVKQHLLNNGPDIFDVIIHLEPFEKDLRE